MALQIAEILISKKDEALFFGNQKKRKLLTSMERQEFQREDVKNKKGNSRNKDRKKIKCHKCGKLEYIKRYCKSKTLKGNASMSKKHDKDKSIHFHDWDTCLTATVMDGGRSSLQVSLNQNNLENG